MDLEDRELIPRSVLDKTKLGPMFFQTALWYTGITG